MYLPVFQKYLFIFHQTGIFFVREMGGRCPLTMRDLFFDTPRGSINAPILCKA